MKNISKVSEKNKSETDKKKNTTSARWFIVKTPERLEKWEKLKEQLPAKKDTNLFDYLLNFAITNTDLILHRNIPGSNINDMTKDALALTEISKQNRIEREEKLDDRLTNIENLLSDIQKEMKSAKKPANQNNSSLGGKK